MNPLELFLDVRPVFVKSVGDSGGGVVTTFDRAEHVEFSAPRDVADVDSVGAGRLEHIDIPVVHAAVDRNISDVLFGGGGGVFTGDIHDSQDGACLVPILPHGRAGT